ncbi:hypothetical protein GCM10012320_08320 [Sinomonas cellulolyticus]|uniref:VWFA domain-containing protein n=1 Tax=Sinomonas cellulolyticus TaxID=2801916 RepID=A0ABS1K3M9_9MICC|nr:MULTISPECIES: hypothetical protein [Sinomonas]MBL0706294.1 hypothetical protein [Sinomonas cellulolyticus]GHG43900.1 hypothetical protein GCM10012320_08320 [Sinomonas sp. KCTC 49339]
MIKLLRRGALALSLLSLAACTNAVPQDLQGIQHASQACADPSPDAQIAIDLTASVRTPSLPTRYEQAVRDIATRVAACDGRLRVFAFTTSDAATVTLLDRSFHVPSGTENGHLRQVVRTADDAVSDVRAGYAKVGTTLSDDATDVVAQFGQAADWAHQQGQTKVELVVLTDGFQTVGPQPITLTAASATSGAFGRVPDLSGWNVMVAGLGRSNGNDAASDVTAQLRAFYGALCDQMHAAKCAALTDYAPRWS